MRAVITVIGTDMVGILHKISGVCAARGVNIIDVSQTVMSDLFAMIMLTDISAATAPFQTLREELEAAGRELRLSVHIMHEDIFSSMHKI